MFEIIQRLYDSPLATAIRESDNLFPILQTFHIVGTIALAGAIAIVDLRLLDVAFRREAPAKLAESLLPITWIGFGIMLVSGGLLFLAQSAKIYGNVFLRGETAAARARLAERRAVSFDDLPEHSRLGRSDRATAPGADVRGAIASHSGPA